MQWLRSTNVAVISAGVKTGAGCWTEGTTVPEAAVANAPVAASTRAPDEAGGMASAPDVAGGAPDPGGTGGITGDDGLEAAEELMIDEESDTRLIGTESPKLIDLRL